MLCAYIKNIFTSIVFIFLLIVGGGSEVYSAAVSPYDDPRIKAWSEAYLKGSYEKVRLEAEADLLTSSPHIFSRHIWSACMRAQGKLTGNWKKDVSEPVRSVLGPLPDLMRYDFSGEWRKAYAVAQTIDIATTVDPFTNLFVKRAAKAAGDRKLSKIANQKNIISFPNMFLSIWELEDELKEDLKFTHKIKEMISADKDFLPAVFVQQATKMISQTNSYRKLDREGWLNVYPNDAYAHLAKAYAENDSRNYPEALKYAKRYHELYPFREIPELTISRYLNTLGRQEEARAWLEVRTPIASGLRGEDLEIKIEVYVAHALQLAGQKGRAREVLEAALKKWPRDLHLNRRMQELEYSAGRYEDAQKFAETASQDKLATPSDHADFMWVLFLTNEKDEARKYFKNAKANMSSVSLEMYEAAFHAGATYDEKKIIGHEIVKKFPSSPSSLHRLINLEIKNGKGIEAYDLSKRALERSPIAKSTVFQHLNSAKLVGGVGKVAEVIAKLRQRGDGYKEIYSGIETYFLNNKDREWADRNKDIYEFKQQARVDHPEDFEYHADVMDYLIDQKKWGPVQKILNETRDRFSTKTHYHYVRARFLKGRRKNAKKDSPDVNWAAAQEILDKLEALGGSGEYYFTIRYELAEAFGKNEQACQELQELAKINLDNTYVVSPNAFSLSPLCSRLVFRALHEQLTRRPMDGKVYKNAIEYHSKWGGSKIFAYNLLQKLKSIDPDKYNDAKGQAGHIFESFGLGAKAYEIRYENASSISNSERYVGWFNRARKKAYEDQNRIEFNKTDNSIKVFLGDGAIREQRDDPVCGLKIWQRRGVEWSKLQSTKNCKVKSIEYSDGTLVEFIYENAEQLKMIRDSRSGVTELFYDDAGEKIIEQKLTRLDKTSEHIKYKHDENGKPTKVELVGVGEINITYDENNEIEKVLSPQGHGIVLKVTEAMQNLVAGTSIVERHQKESVRETALDATSIARVEEFRNRIETAEPGKKKQAALYEFVEFLTANINKHKDYSENAEALLREELDDVLRKQTDVSGEHLVKTVLLLRDLYAKIYPEGLPAEKWKYWSALEHSVFAQDAKVAQIFFSSSANSLYPGTPAKWLQRSFIDNPGYWRKHTAVEVMGPGHAQSTKANAVLVRRNGQLLVGTSKGLFSKRQGSWLRYIFDQDAGTFRLADQESVAQASSDILSLTESTSGALWIGTANGLLRVEKLGGETQRWVSKLHGLQSPRITRLVPWRDGVAVGTALGLTFFDKNGVDQTLADIKGIAELNEEILFLRSKIVERKSDSKESNAILLFGAGEQVLTLSGGAVTQVSATGADDAILYRSGSEKTLMLMTLSNNMLYHGIAHDLSQVIELFPVPAQRNILFSKQMYGFSAISIEQDDEELSIVTVLTDQGISFWHNNYFEHKKLPFADKTRAVKAMSSSGRASVMIADGNTIYAIEKQQIWTDKNSAIHDLITDPVLKATYIARPGKLEIMFHKEGEIAPPAYIGDFHVTHLDLSAEGALIFNNGTEILRLERGSDVPKILFDAATTYEDLSDNKLTSILAARDGSIWATHNGSVFRWKDDKVEEFNYFLNKETFPLPNNWLSRVLETSDGRIWVVASRESPLSHQGYTLNGGLLEWRDGKFVLLDPERKKYGSAPWFITGYTKIDSKRGIVGTADGFALHRGGELELFSKRKDRSYIDLRKRMPSLFLGRRGAKLGGDVWLFPSAGGVVAYNKGIWFYPDRLNWMLPDQHLAQYGARTTHAVATDEYGKIYVGTDRGLLVYDSGGGDAVSFLVSNRQEGAVFMASEQEKLRQQRDIFFKNLKKTDPRYKQIQQFESLSNEIDSLDAQLARAGPFLSKAQADKQEKERTSGGFEAPNKTKASEFNRELFEKRLKRKKRKLAKLLHSLENKSPGLNQLLQIKPLELAALQKDIGSGDSFVQFLPTKNKLHILYLSRKEQFVRQVNVTATELNSRISKVRRLMDLAVDGLSDNGIKPSEADNRFLWEQLHWLYQKLILPIEGEVYDSKRVFFVPTGKLTYLPFSALVRTIGKKPVFLAEKVAVGQMPSMYLFSLALRHQPSISEQVLIFGDPDGSLAGARSEAGIISKIIEERELESVLKIGDTATYDELEAEGPLSKSIHLATHGVLDSKEPQNSFLVLADNRRLSMIDIELLDLKETDLIFLSACESGLGRSGNEYATLARSFSHAGVPNVIASLWKVDDRSTQKLSEQFYKNFEGDPMLALAKAKRELIKSENYSHPAAWSGFVNFGMSH